VILRSLAELKSVKDVLIGRIKADHVLAYLLPEEKQRSSISSSEDPLSVMQNPVPNRTITTTTTATTNEYKDHDAKKEEDMKNTNRSSTSKKQHDSRNDDGEEGVVVDGGKEAVPSHANADANANADADDELIGEETEKVTTTNDEALSLHPPPNMEEKKLFGNDEQGQGDVPAAPEIEQSPPLFLDRLAAAATTTKGKEDLMKKHEALLDDLLGDDDDEDEKLRSKNRAEPSDIGDASLFGNEGGIGFEDGDDDPFGK